MKLSPEKNSHKKKIPTIDEYKKGQSYTKDMFMATAFSLGLALTPLMITGCNSGTPGSLKPKTQVSKTKYTKKSVNKGRTLGIVAPDIKNNKKIEKTELTLGEPRVKTKDGESKLPCEVIENGEMRMGQRVVKHIDEKKPELKKDIIDKVRRPKGQKPFKPKTKPLKGD